MAPVWRLWPLWAMLALQAALVAHDFPLSQLGTAAPMLGIDHPYHLYQVRVAQALADLGRLTGYDPFFGAGYVAGVTFNGSAKGPALLAWLLSGTLGEAQAYKLYVATVAVVAPAAVALAATLARLPTRQVALCAALAVVLWWASGFHWYHTAGLVSFVFASFVALPFCIGLNRLLDAPRAAGTLLLLGACGALCFLIHPFFAIPVIFFGLLRLVVAWPGQALQRWLPRLAWLAALCVLPNLPWIHAMSGQASIGPSRYAISYQMLVDARIAWQSLLGMPAEPGKGAKVGLLLSLLTLAALTSLRSSGPLATRHSDATAAQPHTPLRTLCLSSVFTALALLLFAAFGAALPFIGPVQPNRFSTTALLFLVLPAALGASRLATLLRSGRGATRWAAVAVAGVSLVIAAASLDEVQREVSYAPSGRYGSAPPEVRGVGPKGQALLQWLAAETTPQGRVLFETSLGRVHDGGHIAGYLQLQSGREFIGGPYNNFFAGTRDGWMFGRPLADISAPDFLAYLRLYNIGWIVAHSQVMQRYLLPFVGPNGSIEAGQAFEGLQTYRVRQPLSFVERGQADIVSRSYGKLVVAQRGVAGTPIVLKYHHVPGLHAADGSPVEATMLLDDPDPFIKVTPRGATVELIR